MSDNLKCQFDLFEVLKAHSRTSSSGVLSVNWDNSDLALIMNEGKIIGVNTSSNELSILVLESIARRLSMSDSELKAFLGTNIFSKASQTLLSQKAGVLPHEIENIQRLVESEELKKLNSFKDGHFEFNLAIPESSRSYVINISPGQLILDLVQVGFRIAITEPEKEFEEPGIEVKKEEPQPKVTEKAKKPGDTKSLERSWQEGKSLKTIIRMLNYKILTPEGAKLAYLATGLFLILLCGWRIPSMFASLVNALAELAKV